MEQNKIRTYLLYAVGEIALVMIGILLALQIINWNENVKENKLEEQYYCRMVEDLTQDNETILQHIQLSESRIKASNQALRLLQKGRPKKGEIGLAIGLSIRGIYSDFQPSNAAFEDLKSGANLNIISDKSIIKALNNYFNTVSSIKSIINLNAQNAVDIYFSNDQNFQNGKLEAQIDSERLKETLEKDVYEALSADKDGLISEEMKNRLYNEAFSYLSANSRQLELQKLILGDVNKVIALVEPKCINL
tara:strand:- start:690 stop:1436 length:747 start_codon:yes stop_codon:yes gene_type:complete